MIFWTCTESLSQIILISYFCVNFALHNVLLQCFPGTYSGNDTFLVCREISCFDSGFPYILYFNAKLFFSLQNSAQLMYLQESHAPTMHIVRPLHVNSNMNTVYLPISLPARYAETCVIVQAAGTDTFVTRIGNTVIYHDITIITFPSCNIKNIYLS